MPRQALEDRTKRARYWLNSLVRVRHGTYPGYSFAVIHLALGENDQALEWLEKDAREQTGFEINFIKVDPYLDPLRGDPRFKALVQAVIGGMFK